MTDFAARPPMHDGGFVGVPSHLATERGRYSRWEATPTTFGPAVRVGASVFLLVALAVGLFVVFFILWFVQLFLTGWLLKEIWRPGWVPAAGPAARVERSASDAVEPIAYGRRVPPRAERVDPVPDGPRSPGEIAGIVALGLAGVSLAVVFVAGTAEMRMGAIMIATLLGMFAFFRSFLT